MSRTTRHLTARSALAVLLGVAAASCASNSNDEPQVEGVGSELNAAGSAAQASDWTSQDTDDNNDNNDKQRFRGQRGDRKNRNICPLVDAMAEPSVLRVGQKAKLRGFVVDEDRRPRPLQYLWTASPANIGVIKNPAKKNTHFKCLKPGAAKLTLSASDGSCTRKAYVTISCLPVQQPVCGNGVVEPGETCDGPTCPVSCDDGNLCTTEQLVGSAATCDAMCAFTPVTQCGAVQGCCPPGCTNCAPFPPSCGNGVIEPGETCDGNCPASCDDGVACTRDVQIGSPTTCTVACAHTPITECSSTPDACCGSGCNSLNDADCGGPHCNNGVVEPLETCDPPSTCPTSCDDGIACTTDAMIGSAATCDVSCVHSPITACSNGDGCCPSAACSHANDNDCPPPTPSCGNGLLEGDETCDDGPGSATPCPTSCNDNIPCTTDVRTGAATMCNVRCVSTPITACSVTGDSCCPQNCNSLDDFDCLPVCGNGVVERQETCDGNCPTTCEDNVACTQDEQTGSAASCNLICSHTPNPSAPCECGNGRLDEGEICDGNCPTTCDDANACTSDTLTGSAQTCTAICTHTPVDSPSCNCGNGRLDSGETCDNSAPTVCPTSCPPSGDPCITNVRTGSPESCNVECRPQPAACGTDGDACCPPGAGWATANAS